MSFAFNLTVEILSFAMSIFNLTYRMSFFNKHKVGSIFPFGIIGQQLLLFIRDEGNQTASIQPQRCTICVIAYEDQCILNCREINT